MYTDPPDDGGGGLVEEEEKEIEGLRALKPDKREGGPVWRANPNSGPRELGIDVTYVGAPESKGEGLLEEGERGIEGL
jgi:hypothetical protein